MSALREKLSKKTDAELFIYIDNINKHTDEAVRIAYQELQQRNVELPENTSKRIEEEIEAKAIRTRNQISNSWTKNIVEDENAPEYYSQIAIYIFSILFSVCFGSFMLAENSRIAGRKRWPVILFGVLYTITAIAILAYFHRNTAYTYIANSIGVLIMYELFWKRYIGADTKYRTKALWKPMIISVVIFVPVLYFVIANTPA